MSIDGATCNRFVRNKSISGCETAVESRARIEGEHSSNNRVECVSESRRVLEVTLTSLWQVQELDVGKIIDNCLIVVKEKDLQRNNIDKQ